MDGNTLCQENKELRKRCAALRNTWKNIAAHIVEIHNSATPLEEKYTLLVQLFIKKNEKDEAKDEAKDEDVIFEILGELDDYL